MTAENMEEKKMKKLVTLLAALLSLVMLTAPITAGAETMDMMALQISDPIIAMDGQTMLDLSGLTLQLAAGATEDMSLAQLFLDILAGGETVNSAMVQFDAVNGIAGMIGGMTKAYGVPMEVITALLEQATAEMGDMNSIITESAAKAEQMANWALPQQLTELIGGYIESNAVPAENYTKEVSLSTGAVSAEFAGYTVNLDALMPQIAALLDADATAMELLALMNTEGIVYAESYSELLAIDGVSFTLQMGAAQGDNYAVTDAVLGVNSDGEAINLTLTALNEDAGGVMISDFAVTMAPTASEFAGQEVYLTCNTRTDAMTTVNAHFGYNFGDGDTYDLALMATISDGSLNAMLSDTMGMVNASCVAAPGKFDLTISADGESVNIYALWGLPGFSVGFKGDGIGYFDLTYTPAEAPGYIFKGTAKLSISDTYESYDISLGLGLVPGAIDTANSYIAPEMVTDLTTLDEAGMEAAETELMTALQNTLIVLMENVPGLQMLMGGM